MDSNSSRILFVCSEIQPYLSESPISSLCKQLPPAVQEKGFEIRTFMPRFGNVNERRNQLHEVIRLSGLNLVINESDRPLIIKVASISAARMQIYFIDNEDYFHRKALYRDDDGNFFKDNDERSIFFARGVLETVRKLRWSPDIVHCHGWFSFLIALYLRRAFKDDPLYTDSRIILSFYDEAFSENLSEDFKKKALTDGVRQKDLDVMINPDYTDLAKLCINYSDGIVTLAPVSKDIIGYAEESGKLILKNKPAGLTPDDYVAFYNTILSQKRRRRK
jgi:starch synthase